MGTFAARVGDPHVCPMLTVLVPHVGGAIMPPGVPTVMIGGQPAAIVTSMCMCATGPPSPILLGSFGVFIGGMPAARMGSVHSHGGTVMMGCPTVLIGDIGISIGGLLALLANILQGLLDEAFEASEAVAAALAGAYCHPTPGGLAGALAGGGFGPPPKRDVDKHFFKAHVTFANGNPVAGAAYQLKIPNGKIRKGNSRADGNIVEAGLPGGNCELTLTDLDKDSWKVES